GSPRIAAPPVVDSVESGSCPLWPRARLVAMDAAFTGAVEAAFSSGHESSVAASATVRVGRDGRAAAIEAAIQAAWDLLCSKRGDLTAREVVEFVRERVPNVDQARVRFGLEQRFRGRGLGW